VNSASDWRGRPAVTVLETLTRTVLLPWDDMFLTIFIGLQPCLHCCPRAAVFFQQYC